MKHQFQFTALDGSKFSHLFSLNQQELSQLGAVRLVVDKKPGFPCRVSLTDAEIGEEVILLPYEHHGVSSPYRASGPIFVKKDAPKAHPAINEIPLIGLHRTFSLRGYNEQTMMIEAHTITGSELAKTIDQIFDNTEVKYIQVHNAGPGCYSCQVNRV